MSQTIVLQWDRSRYRSPARSASSPSSPRAACATGLGVDLAWELRIPHSTNLLDFSSIADVLVTHDHTTIDNADLRIRLVREFGRTRDGERGFSLRQNFPDTWWNLTDPGAVDTPLNVTSTTALTDFPAKLEELETAHVAIGLVTPSDPLTPLFTVSLRFMHDGTTVRLGGAATPVDRVADTEEPRMSVSG
ncbi:hypothetical protein [Streptomyces sp. NPDC002758]